LHSENIANSPNIFAIDICEYLDEVGIEIKGNRDVEKKGFTRRKNRQLTPIHIAVYFLHLENSHVSITVEQQTSVRRIAFDGTAPLPLAANREYSRTSLSWHESI
jgi:hypothetical protein